MKTKLGSRIAALLIGVATLLALSGCDLNGSPPEIGFQPGTGPSLSRTITANTTGTDTDGFFYSFWKGANEGGYNGSASMTIDTGTAGNYSTTWNNVSNFTAGKGWSNGSATRVVNFSGSFNGGSNGYLALYGWATTNVATPANYSVVEYYVVESYGDWVPPGGNSLGSFSSDGGTYNIYKMTRTNAPWIVNSGNGTFDQYWSVRTSKRSSGTITFANHIAAWAGKGMTLNNVGAYYQIMESEGYHSSGSSNITVSDGSASSGKWSGLGSGTNASVSALAQGADGTLYAGGDFTTAGGVAANYIAKWNGSSWSALKTGFESPVYALASDSRYVYACGKITVKGVSGYQVRKWSGTTWYNVGKPFNGYVNALVFASDGKLYAGGSFSKNGIITALNIARWNGSNWVQAGDGLSSEVKALVAGSNGVLYAGGFFTKSKNTTARYIAKWDGSVWTEVGGGMDNFVTSLAYRDNVLYAGGSFSKAGTVSAACVAKYSNNAWSKIGSGMNGTIRSFAFNSGGNLIAGGSFTTADGREAKGVAKWNGSAWSAMTTGLTGGPVGRGGDSGITMIAMLATSSGIYGGGWFTADTGPHVAIYK